ncbi:MAG: glycoside hydrolase 43 family protein [Muribaculaceae bacterium]|nr:glycoside hydrolase 43 family protein [Muribaculaceae bacterium]
MKIKQTLIKSVLRCGLPLLAAVASQLSVTAAETAQGPATNPVIWADVPDPDVIRVGDDFYMVSTTMHLMPGCPVMHSRNLVDWTTIGYVFDRLEDHPRYDLQDGTVYGKGQWATSIRYRDGRFYVLFSPNDNPYKSYIYTATDPAGPWELVTRTQHFHDASLLLDDDGRVYVFYNGGQIRCRELLPDLSDVKAGGVDQVVIFPDAEETGLHEGSRVIKHDGKYYAFVISWPHGKPRRQLCYVADNVTGPYEKHVVLESQFGGFPYVGQGCLVDDPDGNWWGMIFQDRGGVGRVLTLNPCTWTDGVPMLGDSEGHVPLNIGIDHAPEPGSGVNASDEFSDGVKSILWQWNHNPVDSCWSLSERPGYLRLRTPDVVDNLFEARNTISQRMMGPGETAEICIDTKGMISGDRAGFAAFNGDTGFIGVDADSNGKYLVCGSTSMVMGEGHTVASTTDTEWERIPIATDKIWLRISTDFNPGRDIATFAYSLDGENWRQAGEPFKMVFDYRRFFMGTRFAIYNYATSKAGGYVDIDYFHLID